jgi:hypothetical protein
MRDIKRTDQMLGRKHLRTACLCGLFVCHSISGQVSPRCVRGIVETSDGTRLTGVNVRITGVGDRPTSDSGEFVITLPSQYEPGIEVEFYVAGWRIINLDEGKIYLPKYDTAVIHIKVSHGESYPQYVFKSLRTKSERKTQQ